MRSMISTVGIKRRLPILLTTIMLASHSFAISAETKLGMASPQKVQPIMDFTAVAKLAIPSAVYIRVQQQKGASDHSDAAVEDFFGNNSHFNDDLLQRFFGMPSFAVPEQSNQPILAQGSGFIVSEDGYILTNNHLIKDASKITVTMNNEKEFDAKLIGTDPNTDVAVIKIEGKNLPYLKLGNSDELEVGQWVAAIGNPFGLQASMTSGIVSAKGRSNLDLTPTEDYIQTDAAINRGNSGGPLLNMKGEAIGINTAIASNTGGYMGIGFAIPSNIAKQIMDQLISSGSVTRGFLGVTLQRIDQDLASAFNLEKPEGGLIADVTKGSPAEKVGLKQGDVILKYNGHLVDNISQFRNSIALTKPGTKIDLTVLRGKETMQLSTEVGTYPSDKNIAANEKSDRLGLVVQDLTPEVAQGLGYSTGEAGVVITKVDPNSISALAGIRKGSLILAVNQEKVATIDEFHKSIDRTEKGRPVLLLIKQGNMMRFVSLKVE